MKKFLLLSFCFYWLNITNLFGQFDKIRLEIFPSPLYVLTNYFDNNYLKTKGLFSIPFKTRFNYLVKERLSIGMGVEEKIFFTTSRHSQWFFLCDLILKKNQKKALSLNTELGIYSFLSEKIDFPHKGMSLNYTNGVFLRTGFTWNNTISNGLLSSIFLGIESNFKNKFVEKNDWRLSLKLGLGIGSITNTVNDKDSLKRYKFNIGAVAFNTILTRKNDLFNTKYDIYGNKVNDSNSIQNSEFFLGRITPGIEFSFNSKYKTFYSIGLIYGNSFQNQVFIYNDIGKESYQLKQLGFYSDITRVVHPFKLDYLLALPYLGIRIQAIKKEINYLNENSQIASLSNTYEKYLENSKSTFTQLVFGAKILKKRYYFDVGFALNIIGFINTNYNYHSKYNEISIGIKEINKIDNKQEILTLNQFINKNYFFKDVFIKFGINI